MDFRSGNGFILPFALLIAISLVGTGMLFLEHGIRTASNRNQDLSRIRLEETLLALVPCLADSLAGSITDPSTTSAIVGVNPGSGKAVRGLLLNENWPGPAELSSNPEVSMGKVLFTSLQEEAALPAHFLNLTPSGQPTVLEIAWAMENIGLYGNGHPTPAFWPLPGWGYAPASGASLRHENFLDKQTHETWRQGPWISEEEALPLSYWRSPGLIPIVESLRLQMGIFASGPPRSREKIIRVRFYLVGSLWNPYNRPLQVHYGSGRRASFRVIFWNLPEIRLHNRSLGIHSAWIPLDEAENALSRENGIHGWITLPNQLKEGEIIPFLEPDPQRQPEGLARTLHPAFPVGSGHRIEIEFRDQPGGVYAACLPLDSGPALSAALNGKGWFRMEGFPVVIPGLQFNTATSPPRPFLLEGGSLSFRQENVHLEIKMGWHPSLRDQGIDRRRRVFNFLGGQEGPGESWLRDRDLLSILVRNLSEETHKESPPASVSGFRAPLFSWPGHRPQSLLEASDLPEWQNAFRLGTRGADRLNRVLNQMPPWAPGTPLVLQTAEQATLRFQQILPVNTRSAATWEAHLRSTAVENDQATEISWASYPVVTPLRNEDFLGWSPMETRLAAHRLTTEISAKPCSSVADFFNRGILEEAFGGATVLEGLMPLRGWLRKAQPVAARGCAWILHLAARGAGETGPIWRTARAWLMEIHKQPEQPSLEVIHFEWTTPSDHLQDPSG